MGFRRGSYRCVCQRGFFFPNATAGGPKYFNGSTLEEEYEKQMKVSRGYFRGSSGGCFGDAADQAEEVSAMLGLRYQ